MKLGELQSQVIDFSVDDIGYWSLFFVGDSTGGIGDFCHFLPVNYGVLEVTGME